MLQQAVGISQDRKCAEASAGTSTGASAGASTGASAGVSAGVCTLPPEGSFSGLHS